MNVKCKVDVQHDRDPAQITTKHFRGTITIEILNVGRGEPVVGTLEKALKGANEAVLGTVRHY